MTSKKSVSESAEGNNAAAKRPGETTSGEARVQIPGYQLFDVVGQGGAGVVYRAQRKSDGSVTAVKILRRELCFDSLMLNRFEREIQAISMLKHPNIVDVYDVGQSSDGRPFYSMEFLHGKTLKETLQTPPRLSVHQAIAFFSEVSYAISYAHEQGIVHRDLKSSNVVVIQQGDAEPKIKLLDFGVAKFLEPQPGQRGLTRQGMMLGSTSAMSPEQIRGQPVDRRADIYALGVMLFELLTGELPFVASEPEDLLRMHLEQATPLPSQRHRPVYAFDAIVARAMQKRREDRFDSARDLIDACQSALQRPGLRPNSVMQRVPALGLCARIEAESSELDNPSMLKNLAGIHRLIADSFREAGFNHLISTMHAHLGLAILPDSPSKKSAVLSQAEQLLLDLSRKVNELPDKDPALQVSMTLHIEDAEISSKDENFIAGPILQFEDWSMTSRESAHPTRITPLFTSTKEELEQIAS